MIICLIVAAILIAALIMFFIGRAVERKHPEKYSPYSQPIIKGIGCGVSIIFGIAAFAIAVSIAFTHLGQDVSLACEQAQREALVYQKENGLYLGGALGEFNADIIVRHMMNESPWMNWFVADYVMKIEPIDTSE